MKSEWVDISFATDIKLILRRRRQRHLTPVLLPGKSHGRRSLVGCSPWGRWGSDTTEWLHFHFSLSCIGEGNGNPLQCCCLENSRDRGAWWAAVYGVAQSRTRLKWLSSSSRVSPSSSVKNIISLMLVLTIWWHLCVESSHMWLEECLLSPVCSLDKILLAFSLLHFVFQGQTCLLLQISLDFPLMHSSPLSWKGHLLGVLVLEGLVGHHRPIQLQLL